jgi:superfamily II RNA helicase
MSGAPEEEKAPPTTVWKGFKLSSFQQEAIGAIRAGQNVLVSAPTGAGKTLVAEYAIVDAVRRGRRCIFTAPIKALSNQKYRDFRDDPEIDVGLMTGDVTIKPGAQVLIMTTEILRNAIFDSPETLHDVEYVIFDEVHFMDDRERGTVWEESFIFAPPEIRFIALSATIQNLGELGEWIQEIREHDVAIVHSDVRPVPLSHCFYTEISGSFEPSQLKQVRATEGQLQAKSRKGSSSPRRGRRGRGRGRGRGAHGPNPNQPPQAMGLFEQLFKSGDMPALMFCFSRKDCERLARYAMNRDFLNDDEHEDMLDLQEDLIDAFQMDDGMLRGEIFQMARLGIGYHHAGMLPAHKEIVERFFTSGLIKLLITTETFAVGINMPARTVIFNALRKFDGVNFDYMRTRDFLQMAGRAGRQGLDTEGMVYTMLSPRDLQEAPVERLLAGMPEPVESRFRLSFASLLHLTRRLGQKRVHEAWEKSFNQFQHRDASKKEQGRNRRMQRQMINSHLDYLSELGYLRGDDLLPRGKVAQSINGYELQVTELLFQGILEDCTAEELAVIFVGLIHEERRTFEPIRIPRKLHGDLRQDVDQVLRRLFRVAQDFDLPQPPKRAEWGLTGAVMDWVRGCPFDELQGAGPSTPGDICRSFRLAIQLLRQARRVTDKDLGLHAALGEAMECLNRDEVDARQQLEVG